jgi:hypothetical protein
MQTPLPFLCWRPISLIQNSSQSTSDRMVIRRPDALQDKDAKAAAALVNVNSLTYFLHTRLCDHEVYIRLPSGSKRALDKVAASLSASTGARTSRDSDSYRAAVEICRSASLLVNHFIPEDFTCPLKEKFYGGLAAILKVRPNTTAPYL